MCSAIINDGVDLGVDFAEAMAIRRALNLALEKGFLSICVESDSLRVINILKNQSPVASYLSLVISDIRRLCLDFSSINFCHVFREANTVAHNLAKHSISVAERVWMGDVPLDIRSCIHSDTLAALFE